MPTHKHAEAVGMGTLAMAAQSVDRYSTQRAEACGPFVVFLRPVLVEHFKEWFSEVSSSFSLTTAHAYFHRLLPTGTI
jgi:hypothetical protein